MKRWLAHLTIASYLTVLAYGVVAHAVKYRVDAHPAMYYIVWDMFCGWSAYSSRTQIIGEGESGRFYKLAPGPWGEYHPYANLGRRHYDSWGKHHARIAMNNLRHTQHEPISRVIIVEESWAKKFNLPDQIWTMQYNEPKDKHVYYHVRSILRGDGYPLQRNVSWYSRQLSMNINDNPRLQADQRRGQPVFQMRRQGRMGHGYAQGQPYRRSFGTPSAH